MGDNKSASLLAVIYRWGGLLALSILVLPLLAKSPVWASNGLIGQSQTIIDLTNTVRRQAGVGELAVDQRLMTSAKNKANDMARRGYFDHVSPEGWRMSHWMNGEGYNYLLAGENLAKGFSSPDKLMQAWTNSLSHYVNLGEPKFQHIGVGIAEGIYNGQATVFVVQHFGMEQTVPVNKITIADNAGFRINDLVVPIANMIASKLIALAAPAESPTVAIDNQTGTETINAISADQMSSTDNNPSPNSWLVMLAILLLAIVGYFEDTVSAWQINRALFLRKIFRLKSSH